MQNGTLLRVVTIHNHEPSAVDVDIHKIKTSLKRKAGMW